jgi:hypothetical protein
VKDAALAVLPYLLFGLRSLLVKLEVFPAYSTSLPLWQVMIFHPFLSFNWLVLVGLGISLALGFPRWGYAYLVSAVLFGWWWGSMGFHGYHFQGEMWLPLLGVILLVPLLRRSLHPLRAMLAGLWKEWTLLSFAIYTLYAHTYMIFDSSHNPYLLI